MNKLKVTQKEKKILNLLLTNMVTKKKIFRQMKKTGLSLKTTTTTTTTKAVVLNILYVPYSTEEMRHADKIKA